MPYAPESACVGDWHLIRTFTNRLFSIAEGASHSRSPSRWVITALTEFAYDEAGEWKARGRFGHGNWVAWPPPYTEGSCQGRDTTITEKAYQIVLVGPLTDGGVGHDCWSVFNKDDLRHVVVLP